jgi:hypothetical protein
MPPPLPEEMPTATPTPGCPIPVLESEPTEPFELMAILEVASPRSPQGADMAMSAAKIRACALGGDAIVILYAKPRDPRPVPGIAPRLGVLEDPAVSVAVIRYRQR